MNLHLSKAGEKLTGHSGIVELMDDLGEAMSAPDTGGEPMIMMGGGNPGHIPAMQEIWRQSLRELIEDTDRCDRVLTNYDAPAGSPRFRKALAECLGSTLGWNLGPENIAVTSGGQTAFFFLFTLLAGETSGGAFQRVLLPLVPEYIGYADQGLHGSIFASRKPRIEHIGDHDFKYHVDFDNLDIERDITAICASRPTNPTGNVLTNEEVDRLASLARERDIPLIIDNAYGAPFPGAVFEDIQPTWDPGIILTFSLSKLGLPGTRTGIVVAHEDIIRKISSMTSIVGLANNNVGQAIVRPLIENGELLRLSREVIQPFYLKKSIHARELVREYFRDDFPYAVHRSEGAFFLWLWFPELPITTRELYERLKKRRLLVIPGEYFFYGLPEGDEPWEHASQCIRITFSQPEEIVRQGIEVLADELRQVHG